MIGALVAAVSLGLATPESVLPGVLDLPLLDGARLAPECLGYRERLSEGGDPFACVQTRFDRVNDLALAYVQVAETQGWTRDGGAASALYLQRRTTQGVCQRLTVAGMWNFERTPRPRPRDPAFVLIAFDPEIRCPRPSAAP